ncbi:c-type cytochrome [Ferrovibrio xuzhouensis]|uniref:C-type cytochrome n=1 Tax=Ferrovibrio xuzhouensis TaxID=1576914 RepID=A0ABV7VJF3_9PROT
MLRPVFCCCLALAGFALVPLARAGAPSDLASVTVDLPDSDRTFPDGPGAAAINDNCLACHSAGMVLNQPAMPRAAWAAEVGKMINAYKAPVAQEDVDAIVDYLTHTKGSK